MKKIWSYIIVIGLVLYGIVLIAFELATERLKKWDENEHENYETETMYG